MNERLLSGPHVNFHNEFHEKKQVFKSKEEIVIIKNKLYIGNIKCLVKKCSYCSQVTSLDENEWI